MRKIPSAITGSVLGIYLGAIIAILLDHPEATYVIPSAFTFATLLSTLSILLYNRLTRPPLGARIIPPLSITTATLALYALGNAIG